MTKVRDAMSDVLDRITLAEMVAIGGQRNIGKGSAKRKTG